MRGLHQLPLLVDIRKCSIKDQGHDVLPYSVHVFSLAGATCHKQLVRPPPFEVFRTCSFGARTPPSLRCCKDILQTYALRVLSRRCSLFPWISLTHSSNSFLMNNKQRGVSILRRGTRYVETILPRTSCACFGR